MKILFVDDEVQILRGLKRMLHCMDDDWDADFVTSGTEALDRLGETSFDVVVSDMRMPGMDGAELLSRVSTEWPQTVRIILSGQASRGAVLRAVEPMHQYLSKPCSADTLRQTVARSCQLRDVLHSADLERLVGAIRTLPSIPSLYTEVMDEIESPDGTASAVGEIVARDPGMTAKILQIANSAALGLGPPVCDPVHAVSMLGMDIIKSLVLSVGVFSQLDVNSEESDSIQQQFNHSMRVAALARQIAASRNCSQDLVGEAFTAGTLHDIGKLILFTGQPDACRAIRETRESQDLNELQAEQQILGTNHAAIGAYLLSIWGLPQPLVEAIAFHHQPNLNVETEFSSLTAVSAANLIVRETEQRSDDQLTEAVTDHLQQIGLADQLSVWRDLNHASEDSSDS